MAVQISNPQIHCIVHVDEPNRTGLYKMKIYVNGNQPFWSEYYYKEGLKKAFNLTEEDFNFLLIR
jgi:uncharacterized membrane protein